MIINREKLNKEFEELVGEELSGILVAHPSSRFNMCERLLDKEGKLLTWINQNYIPKTEVEEAMKKVRLVEVESNGRYNACNEIGVLLNLDSKCNCICHLEGTILEKENESSTHHRTQCPCLNLSKVESNLGKKE